MITTRGLITIFAVFVIAFGGYLFFARQVLIKKAGEAPRVVRVCAASSLEPVLEPLAVVFRKANPGVDVQITLGSSGALSTQIAAGLECDVFISADDRFVSKLIDSGRGVANSRQVLCSTGLSVLLRKELTISPTDALGAIDALADARVKNVAVANPQTAPVGEATRVMLHARGVHDKLSAKFVQADSAERAAAFILQGSAQAAILSTSLAHRPAMLDVCIVIDLPTDIAPPLPMTMVMIAPVAAKTSARTGADDALAFGEFLKSADARRLLAEKHFAPGAK